MLEQIDPAKDADGLHPVNLGRLVLGYDGAAACTPRGIVELLRRYDVPLRGAEVAVIGRGNTVGRPLGLLLTRRSENATVTLCHTGTRDLAGTPAPPTSWSSAAGVPGLVTADMVRPGAAVVDVGISRVIGADGKVVHRRRRRRGGRGGRHLVADARRRRADDPGHAADQRGRTGRAG